MVHGGPNTLGPLLATLTAARSGGSWSVSATSPLSPGKYTAQAERGALGAFEATDGVTDVYAGGSTVTIFADAGRLGLVAATDF